MVIDINVGAVEQRVWRSPGIEAPRDGDIRYVASVQLTVQSCVFRLDRPKTSRAMATDSDPGYILSNRSAPLLIAQ